MHTVGSILNPTETYTLIDFGSQDEVSMQQAGVIVDKLGRHEFGLQAEQAGVLGKGFNCKL